MRLRGCWKRLINTNGNNKYSSDMEKKNRLIVIGYLGRRICYLNIEENKAIEMYCKSEKISIEEFNEELALRLDVIYFDDTFIAYDAWE